ncbi:MAG: S-(hydroxymethyl)glutathione dehydrogenase/alcohol dehydrogenase [Acidimicrobiales bacterium]|jgi:S-(hydroxymethyl)glutathione dehydrogenase / alcohol dehydrogenase
MRGVVVEQPGGPALVVDDLEVEEPRSGEVLIDVEHCALCHSDVTVQNSMTGGHPVALGHEAAGRVASLGPGVENLLVGQPVVLAVAPACGTCRYCVRGESSLCVQTSVALRGVFPDGSSRLARKGVLVRRGVGLGAMAEQVVVSRAAVVAVPADTPLDLACVLGCGVGTGLGAVLNTAAVKPAASMLIAGLGGVGMAGVLAGVVAGAAQIIVSDPVPERRDLALELGATTALDPASDDIVAASIELTGDGVDDAFDMTGNADVVSTLIRAIRPGGAVTLVGVPDQISTGYQIDRAAMFVMTEKTLRGCVYGSSNAHRDIPRYLELWRAGRLDLDRLITARRPLADIDQALTDLHTATGIRTVLDI